MIAKPRQRAPGGGRKASPQSKLNRREVLTYIRDHSPCTTAEIEAATKIPNNVLRNVVTYLRDLQMIKATARGNFSKWEFLRFDDSIRADAEIVDIKGDGEWLKPVEAEKISRVIVPKYSYTPAPRGRFEVDIKPGCGVISYDNPGLASLAMRTG